MRKLSVSEFQEWVRNRQPEEYIFSSENNTGSIPAGLYMRFRFRDTLIRPDSRRICFGEARHSICFDEIKEVIMYEDRESIGTVFDIVCKKYDGVVSYRMIAD